MRVVPKVQSRSTAFISFNKFFLVFAKVVFDSGENVSAFGESQFDDQSTFVYVQDSEVTGIDKSSVLEIDSTVYFVTEISSDGTGVTLVRLTTGKVRL